MKEGLTGNSMSASDEYGFSLARGHIAAPLFPLGLVTVGVFEANAAFHSFGGSVLFLMLGGYALVVELNGVDTGWHGIFRVWRAAAPSAC